MDKAALISVFDKNGIVELSKFLENKGYKILSTGSTGKLLQKNGVNVIFVEDYTSFKEILDGRVKTLHPLVHAGILFKRNNKEHTQTVNNIKALSIDIVVVNLYPFEKVALSTDNIDELIENIDIGGPTLLRAAAKNYKNVLVICDPNDYKKVMENFDKIDENARKEFALKAFSLTSYYDGIIVDKLSGKKRGFYQETLPFKLINKLRYGENPHQEAYFVKDPLSKGIANLEQLNGKELSYNNLLDIDVAYRMMLESRETLCTIIKHNTPCGVSQNKDIIKAYENALSCDPISAFGGIIGINSTVTKELAKKITERFYEVVVAFDFEDEAVEILKEKKNLRVIKIPKTENNIWEIRSITGGYLIQQNDTLQEFNYEIVSKKQPTKNQIEDLEFAFFVAKFVKSNAIVYAKNKTTKAIGGGQTSRIDSAKFAAERAKSLKIDLKGCVMASDGFFPFRDSIDLAHSVGVEAVVEPGGSIRDKESIEAANEHDMVLMFTHARHFRH